MRQTFFSRRDVLQSPSFQIAVVILFFFLLSLLFLSLKSDRRVKRTFFFPQSAFSRASDAGKSFTEGLHGEIRWLPIRKGWEANMRLFVEDLLLGPIDPMHVGLLPRETRLISLFLNKGVLYLNLSADILKENPDSDLSLALKIKGAANNVLYNFPILKKLYIFVEGQIPDFSALYAAGIYDFSDGISFDPSIME